MSTSRTVLSDISSNSNLKRSHSDSIVEIAKSKRQKTEEKEEEDKENDSPSPSESFEEEEDEEEPSVVAFLSSPGELHPRSKQYFVYSRGKPSVISKTARCWCLKYLKVLNHVDPDAYDMYIHNDFMCYGELEVIENVLLDLSKDYFPSARSELNFPRAIYAFRRWEALILLLQSSFAWTGIDHGQRMLDMVRLLGACSVTILRQLFPPAFFEPLHEQFDDQRVKKISDRLVNFKEILEQSISLGYQLSRIAGYSSAFTRLLQIVYCNWLFLTEHRRFDFSTIDPSTTNDQSLWQGLIEASQMKIKRFNESFRFFQVLQHYRKFYPEMGGDQHDLRKWPKARRDQFSYARLEQEDNDDQLTNFWLRM